MRWWCWSSARCARRGRPAHGGDDRLCRLRKVLGGAGGSAGGQHGAFEAAQDRDISQQDVARGEERGQHVGRFARPVVRGPGVYEPVFESHWDFRSRRLAITLEPPATRWPGRTVISHSGPRSEEHTSELQSPCNLVCRLLLEKKK